MKEITKSTVLLVDDEENILKSIQRLLSDSSYKILTAGNAVQAIEIIKNNSVSVIVSDHRMPGTLGVDLLSQVKTISPDTVRILLTGYADLDTAIDAINRGEVFRFIKKPWENHALKEIIEEAQQRHDLILSLKHSDESTLLSLAQTIELKDAYTRGHCDNVARYAKIIALGLQLNETILEQIRFGSWLHDCGKIGVPEKILNKEGPLTADEFEIIKKHPTWGADVARQAKLQQIVVNIILHHHEKYGGKGYPTGLAGNDIPLEARIVAVADVFDALTTNRSYRGAYDFDKAGDILLSMKRSHLDPKLVDIFLQNMPSPKIRTVQ